MSFRPVIHNKPPPIYVYFHNFWNGFIEKTDAINITFFMKLLEKVYERPIHIARTPSEASILIESIFGAESHVYYKKWAATILFTGESNYYDFPHVDKFDCVLGFEETGGKFVKCPLYVLFLISNPTIMRQLTGDMGVAPSRDAVNTIIPPNKASVIISNVHGTERLSFLENLEKKMPVNYGGKYKNNIGNIVSGHCNSPEMTDFYRRGKFAITMENGNQPYYITEKIVNGFRSGVIPVYWGSVNIGQYFNPRRFLQLKSASQEDMDELANRMVSMTNQEYFDMINEPILARPINDVCDEILESVKKILTSSTSSSSSVGSLTSSSV